MMMTVTKRNNPVVPLVSQRPYIVRNSNNHYTYYTLNETHARQNDGSGGCDDDMDRFEWNRRNLGISRAEVV